MKPAFGKEWTISRLMNAILLQYFMSNKLLESYHDYPYIKVLGCLSKCMTVFECVPKDLTNR